MMQGNIREVGQAKPRRRLSCEHLVGKKGKKIHEEVKSGVVWACNDLKTKFLSGIWVVSTPKVRYVTLFLVCPFTSF